MLTLEQFRSNRNVLFWSLHAAGWGAYGITQYFGALLYEKPSSYAQVIVVQNILDQEELTEKLSDALGD